MSYECVHCEQQFDKEPAVHHTQAHPKKRFDPLWYVDTTDWEEHTDPEEIIKDLELDRAFANANYGGQDPREVIRKSLLKVVGNYGTGHTTHQILSELSLITGDASYGEAELTDRGGHYLFHSFDPNLEVKT